MRGGRLARTVLVGVLVAGVLALSVGAATPQRRPAGSPDLAALALAVSDLPRGTRVVRQRYYRDPDFVASYERELSLDGARVGRSRLLSVLHDLNVEPDAATAERTFRQLSALAGTRAFRSALAAEIAAGAEISARAVTVGRPRRPRIGNGTVSLPVTVAAPGLRLQAALAFTRVDRLLAALTLVGLPGRTLRSADVDGLTRVAAERIGRGLEPALPHLPVVAGAAVHGETLRAVVAGAGGDQVVLEHQWERCATADGGCSPIAGATSPTYTVVTGDLASTVRVTVTARNALASVTASSTTTSPVAGREGAPVATEPPLVEASGSTLTATTGTWTGDPAEFAYQWRRCAPATGACVDVVDATAATYVLTAADSGSTLRVLVVASNAAGPGGALSAPTAPLP